MRSVVLNAVQFSVPRNLHEPEPGKYDFDYRRAHASVLQYRNMF